jgi:hypothetical protein
MVGALESGAEKYFTPSPLLAVTFLVISLFFL